MKRNCSNYHCSFWSHLLLLALMLFLLVAQLVGAKTIVIPSNITIDTTKEEQALTILNQPNSKAAKTLINTIKTNPNDYNPTTLYALSNALFQLNEKEEAAFWFYVGQLRARIDANISMDKSAGQAVGVLNDHFGPQINQYTFGNLDQLTETVAKVLEFVRSNEETYDRRWINLHGMEAVISGLEGKALETLSAPKNEWAAIKKKTIDEYEAGFNSLFKDPEFIKLLREQWANKVKK